MDAAFQYDFGDDWWHALEVLDHRETVKGDKPPRCVAGEGACPPEDSGGPFGYPAMLDAAADPEHPDHEDIKAWLDEFPRVDFDEKKSNRNIRKVLSSTRADRAGLQGAE